mmetsp:Transcript_30646/g.72511  ORF Transcript_30646/g.72511 Transcript_30646/m.72511 type:complete len:406 (-) Transcript_30646:110-1327(-)
MAAMDGCAFSALTDQLVGRMWPSERVVIGLRVSKWARQVLLAEADRVLLSFNGYRFQDQLDATRICADLSRHKEGARLSVKIFLGYGEMQPMRLETFLACIQKVMTGSFGPVLESLDFGDNDVYDEGATKLAEVLRYCPNLRRVNLRTSILEEIGAEQLFRPSALGQCTALTDLDLMNNAFGDVGATHLANALKNCTSLENLCLVNNEMRTEGAQSLAEALRSMRSLTWLNLGKNGVDDKAATALAASLQAHTNLRALSLDDNWIGDAGVRELAGVVARCPSLTILQLSSNRIAADGAEALAQALRCASALSILDLGSNALEEAGVARVAPVLPELPRLAQLGLGWTEMGDAGAEPLVRVLGQCAALKSVFLLGNGLSGEMELRLNAALYEQGPFQAQSEHSAFF